MVISRGRRSDDFVDVTNYIKKQEPRSKLYAIIDSQTNDRLYLMVEKFLITQFPNEEVGTLNNYRGKSQIVKIEPMKDVNKVDRKTNKIKTKNPAPVKSLSLTGERKATEEMLNKYKDISTSSIVKTRNEMEKEILKLAGDNKILWTQNVGYSGASYKEMDLFKNRFREYVLRTVKQAKNELGFRSKVVLTLGGTTDGFGAGYEVIIDLVEKGKILSEDIIIAGMVMEEAVKYHLEGLQNGWGDVIHQQIDVLYLANTYKDNGNYSWELKNAPDALSETVTFLEGKENVSFNVFERAKANVVEYKNNLQTYENVKKELEGIKDFNVMNETMAKTKANELSQKLKIGWDFLKYKEMPLDLIEKEIRLYRNSYLREINLLNILEIEKTAKRVARNVGKNCSGNSLYLNGPI